MAASAKALSATPPAIPFPHDELLTVSDLALILKCKESSVYNLTRRRGQARYDSPVPVLRLPMGLRFRKSSVLAWLESLETGGVQ